MTEPTSDYGRLQEWVQTHVPAPRRAKALEILRGVFDEKKLTYEEFFKSPHMVYGWTVMNWTLSNKGNLDDVKTFRHPDFVRFVATPELDSAQAWRDGQRAGERLSARVALPSGGANTGLMRAAVEKMRAQRATAMHPVAVVLRKVAVKKFTQRITGY